MKIVNNIEKKEIRENLKAMTINKPGKSVVFSRVLAVGETLLLIPVGVKKVVVK